MKAWVRTHERFPLHLRHLVFSQEEGLDGDGVDRPGVGEVIVAHVEFAGRHQDHRKVKARHHHFSRKPGLRVELAPGAFESRQGWILPPLAQGQLHRGAMVARNQF